MQLDLHQVNVVSIPTGPTHGEECLQPRPGDVLKSTPTVRKSPRSGLNLEGRRSDPQVFFKATFISTAEFLQRIRQVPLAAGFELVLVRRIGHVGM